MFNEADMIDFSNINYNKEYDRKKIVFMQKYKYIVLQNTMQKIMLRAF